MKILLINKYWRIAGGVEVHAFEVARWLAARGHEVIPFAMREKDTLPNNEIENFPPEVDFRGGSLGPALKGLIRATISLDSRDSLRDLIKREQPDAAYVLHVYHQLGMGIINELKRHGVPVVLSLHDYKIACPNYRLFSEKTNRICTKCLDRRMGFLIAPVRENCWGGSVASGAALTIEAISTKVQRSYKLADVVTVLNSLQRTAVLRAGVPESRIMAVPHAVPLSHGNQKCPDNGARFLYVGRLVPEKGVDVLIRAAAKSRSSITIAGDGRSRNELQRLAYELSVDAIFLGQVDRKRIEQLMRESRALIVPSIWHEVSPLVVYEAIRQDLPVVASEVGGMVDQLGGSRGYLVRPGAVGDLADTLRAIMLNPEEARTRSLRARQHAATAWSLKAWERNMVEAFSVAGVSV
ncbi:glycosyltransferase [Gordonia polyisoprenivorans]|uniref:glycosyltransferase n=1 Tax=Gordonia polyisoprenivorans TaxID=84595 RepID=UPI001AD70905|nr:glycosyltransferase [Gordonia polyisoprenivorans]QTI70544.1 glycosyltransferase [Gordonia polyisoprenivorans]